MILQELVHYYERKSRGEEKELSEEGFEPKEIPFVLVLDPDGRFRQIEDTRTGEGRQRRAAAFEVPQTVKRASNVAANLLWDTAEYVLGIDTRGKPERVQQQHEAFLARLDELHTDDEGFRAIRAFLANIPLDALAQSLSWPEIVEKNPNLTFRLTNDAVPICERDAVVEAIKRTNEAADGPRCICLVTGEEAEIERLHPAIKGVRGAQSSGANIVSFNLRAFESYGKEQKQGENAPVGKPAVFAYTTALNYLLRKDSRQKMPVGDATVVFWSQHASRLENSFPILLGEPDKDDPDANVREVEALYRSIEQGSLNVNEDSTNTFFVLGLSPNASRISIRFWLTGTVREFSEQIARHFNAIEICHGPREPRYLSLFRLLVSTAQQGKADNIQPNLAGDTMRAILSGLPYPEALLAAALRRIRAEHEANYPRAALIKACLNRASRSSGSAHEEELNVSLDTTNTNVGYRLGRLFAALEKIQGDALPGLNATVRDRFYGAASATPVTVFATLLKLSTHHLAKIENRSWAVNDEKLLQEICGGLDSSGFPAHLSLDDQGRFAIGYYHQKQAFYTKKSEPTEGVKE